MPFRSAQDGQVGTLGKDGWWTCNTSRSPNTFGYSYADVDIPNPQQNFNNKYGWSIRWNKGDAFGKCPSDMLPFNLTKAQVFQFSQSDLHQAKPGIVKAAAHAAHSIMPAGLLSGGANLAQTVAAAVAPAASAAPAAPAAPAAQAVMKADVAPADRTIKSVPGESPQVAPGAEINEATVSRSWYIDMETERYDYPSTFTNN